MLTVITRQLPTTHLAAIKFFLLDLLGLIYPSSLSAWGHYGVTRSLRRGLKLNHFDFNYNPLSRDCLAETVWVLSDPVALEQMIALKKTGQIKHLLAGPNLVVSPLDCDKLITDQSIDKVIVPSPWVADFYLAKAPELSARLLLWPAGIDESYWQADKSLDKNTVLIYQKISDQKLVEQVIKTLNSLGLSYKLIEYGKYQPSQYKRLLKQSLCAIFLSQSESQGLALAEAWSMDVPTFCYDEHSLIYQGDIWQGASSCPYLSESTGRSWQDLATLKKLLETIVSKELSFSPRAWLLDSLTDQKSVEIVINHLKKI